VLDVDASGIDTIVEEGVAEDESDIGVRMSRFNDEADERAAGRGLAPCD